MSLYLPRDAGIWGVGQVSESFFEAGADEIVFVGGAIGEVEFSGREGAGDEIGHE